MKKVVTVVQKVEILIPARITNVRLSNGVVMKVEDLEESTIKDLFAVMLEEVLSYRSEKKGVMVAGAVSEVKK